MKAFHLIFLLLLFFIGKSQHNHILFTEKLDSVVHKSVCAGGDDAFYAYQYDLFGRVQTEVTHIGTSSATPKIVETTHYYNANGFLDSSVTIGYMTSYSKKCQRYFYNGTLIDSTALIFYILNPLDTIGQSYKHFYSPGGDLESQIYYRKLSGQTSYLPIERRVWTYDFQHRLVTDSLFMSDNHGNLPLYRYSDYTYDNITGLLRNVDIKGYLGNLEGQRWYLYNPAGDLVFEEYRDGYVPSYAWGFTYDSIGNATDMTYYGWGNQTWDPFITINTFFEPTLASTTALPVPEFPSIWDRIFKVNRPSYVRYVDTTYNGSLLLTKITYHYSGGVGVDKRTPDSEVSVFPNPASEYLMIKLSKTNESLYQLIITDLQGKTVLNHSVRTDNQVIRINVNTLPAGVYLITLRNQFQMPMKQKFIKQ